MSETTLTKTHNTRPADQPPPGDLHGLMVEFESVRAVKGAARRVREAGYRKWDVHSPFPIHGIDAAIGIRHTRLPWIVFCGGLFGLLAGLALQIWTNGLDPRDWAWLPTWLQGYDFRVSGKPTVSLPAFIPITFETTVLFAALTAVIGMFALNGLPRWRQALFAQPRFGRVTSDRFFIVIDAADPHFDEQRTGEFLRSIGGTHLERIVELGTTPRPRWIPLAIMIVISLATLPPVLVYKANVSLSTQPRIHLVHDMDHQPKFQVQQANPVFADVRAERPRPAGTIARGEEWLLGADPHFYTGVVEGEWAATFPERMEINQALLRRGQQRFDVQCAMCHGHDGGGNGIVAQRAREKSEIARGWVPPSDLHGPAALSRPVGHIFNTITNGGGPSGTMPAYGDQISPADRWAIVAYVRALQRSQRAPVEDVPEEVRPGLR